MSKVVIKSEGGRSTIEIDGIMMKGVRNVGFQHEAGGAFPVVCLEVYANELVIDAEADVKTEVISKC
jgi:hypothetical protein